jgi:hypothetical protein
LSPATIEEIDGSVSRLRGRNPYETPVARDEFPLTTMAEDLARMRQEIATGPRILRIPRSRQGPLFRQ